MATMRGPWLLRRVAGEEAVHRPQGPGDGPRGAGSPAPRRPRRVGTRSSARTRNPDVGRIWASRKRTAAEPRSTMATRSEVGVPSPRVPFGRATVRVEPTDRRIRGLTNQRSCPGIDGPSGRCTSAAPPFLNAKRSSPSRMPSRCASSPDRVGSCPTSATVASGAVLLQRGDQHVDVVVPERGLDPGRHPLERGGRDLGGVARADERARQQDVGPTRDAGQPAGGQPEALPAPAGQRPIVVADPAGAGAHRGRVADQEHVHRGRVARLGRRPGLASAALEARPLVEERGARLLAALA